MVEDSADGSESGYSERPGEVGDQTAALVRDGLTRWLIVIGFENYAKDSGLAPLPTVRQEINDICAAFRELGYRDENHRVWLDVGKEKLKDQVFDLLDRSYDGLAG